VKPKPLLIYSGPLEAFEDLITTAAKSFEVVRVPPEPDAVKTGLEKAAAFLDASMKVRVGAAILRAAPELKVVAVAATGADHIDEEELGRRGIPLLTLRGQTQLLSNLTPAAEHSWLLLMACARQLRGAQEHVLRGGWNRTDFPGIMLRGKVLGIIGCGRIGTWMARYARAFGMITLGYDPLLNRWPEEIKQSSLEELLSQADFVSLHVALSKENRGMINRECFEQMKPGAVFINTSRGDLTDEDALLDALKTGKLGAAALDVLQGEPNIESHSLRHYARDHYNLIITPHIGGFSLDAVRLVVRFSAEQILRHFAG
jgi:phosphoglycerate dehydrogenase-like enzyme